MNKLSGTTIKCPVDAFLKVVGRRWNAYILHILATYGPLRFSKIKNNISGISQKVLTEKLRELEEAKILYRDYKPTSPPEVTYGLTEHGKSLLPLLSLINDISHEWRIKGHL